jgi:serine/threonine-protein kinase RsbT
VPDYIKVAISKKSDVYVASHSGKTLARRMGFNRADQTRVETVLSELAHNILLHAGQGLITITSLRGEEGPGLEIVALDHGPGISDIELAMKDGYSTSGGLGTGLPAVKRLMDDFEIVSAPDQGTKVKAVKWLRPRPG